MSNNAVAAYNADEMPRSKWTKEELLTRCGEKAELLRVLTVVELRDLLLEARGWHHTSSRYNRTNFYGINEDSLDNISAVDVEAIIAARKPISSRPSSSVKTVTAEIMYTVWEGRYRNYRRPVDYTETVTYKSTDKQVLTQHGGVKRLSSLKSIRVLSEEPKEKVEKSKEANKMNLYFVKSGTSDNYIMAETSEGVLCSNCAPNGEFAGVALSSFGDNGENISGEVIAAKIAEALDPDITEDDLAWMGDPCYPNIAAWRAEQEAAEYFNRDEAIFVGSFGTKEINAHQAEKPSVRDRLKEPRTAAAQAPTTNSPRKEAPTL